MSSEIVERLRKQALHDVFSSDEHVNFCADVHEAADHIEALEAENERLSDKVDGLNSDLDNAIETAYHRGAVDWVRMNYPKHFASLSQAKE